MNPKWTSGALSIALGIAAAFAFLPYGWAHLTSGSIAAGVAAVHTLPLSGQSIASGLTKIAVKIGTTKQSELFQDARVQSQDG